MACIKGSDVAFHVYLKNSISYLQHNQIIKYYDTVITNIGEGYDTTTGKFTAPVDGVYSFTWTYMPKKGAKAYICGFVDGKQIVWTGMHDQSATLTGTTGHLVVRIKKGSKFWTPNVAKYIIYIHHFHTFICVYIVFVCCFFK